MKKSLRFLGFLNLILSGAMFFSCASANVSKPTTNPVYVTNTKRIWILPTSEIEKPIDSQQVLIGAFGEQKFTLQAYVFADEGVIEIGLFNDFGTDMGMLVYDNLRAVTDSPIFPPELKAEYILNDFQNAFYKAESIRENLAKVKLDFDVVSTENGQIRRVLNNGKVIEEIEILENEVKVKNILRGYEFSLINAE